MFSPFDGITTDCGCEGDGAVGQAPAENIQLASCPDGSGSCQIATAATQGAIFTKLAGLTVQQSSAEEAAQAGLKIGGGRAPEPGNPNVLYFKAVPKTAAGQLDALSVIQGGVGGAPGSRVAIDLRNALLSGPPGFFYVMLMATPGGAAPAASQIVSSGSDFALVNIENAPSNFEPLDFSKEEKSKTGALIAGALVGGGVGALMGGGVGGVAGAVGGAALANWFVA